MPTKKVVISNTIICTVLLVLSYFAVNLDVKQTYLSVSAPQFNGDRAGAQIALMFLVDQADDFDNLGPMINTLANAQVNATFFVAGNLALKNLGTMQTLGEKFELGNYGFSNRSLNTADKNLITEEISLCDALITSITHQKLRWFTPPDGAYNKNTLAMAEQLGYQTVLPTNRQVVINWQNADTSLVTAYATHEIQPGDIIALRPTTATMQCLAQIIATYTMRNLRVTSVGQLLSAQPVAQSVVNQCDLCHQS